MTNLLICEQCGSFDFTVPRKAIKNNIQIFTCKKCGHKHRVIPTAGTRLIESMKLALEPKEKEKLVCTPTVCGFKSVDKKFVTLDKFVKCKITGEYVQDVRCLLMECSQ